jgi:hypothetical protein
MHDVASELSAGRVLVKARFVAAAVAGLLFSFSATAADNFWALAADLEAAVPFSEAKIRAALGTGLDKEQQGQPPTVVYRTSGFLLKDRSQIEAATWAPGSGKTPSAITLTRPAVAARTDACLSRAEVSRNYGAPVRSWASMIGDVSYTNFEFAQPKAKVSVAFSDVTNCLRTLTITEAR